MTTKAATRLVAPRLAHIAGVDHPAHQIEGFIVAKSLGDESSNFLEGLKMAFDAKEIAKSLEAPLTKDNAAEVIETMQKALSFLVSKEVEKDVSKAAEATDTNASHDDTDVTKTKDEGDEELTMAQKAANWDDLQTKKKSAGEDVDVTKALGSNPEFVAMKKQLDKYQARDLYLAAEAEVKKAAGAFQTDVSGFVTAVIAAGGAETPDGQAILKSLKASAEVMKVGGSLTKEIGSRGVEISSDLKTANSQLKDIAKAISKDENMPLSKALSEATKRNPALREILQGGSN